LGRCRRRRRYWRRRGLVRREDELRCVLGLDGLRYVQREHMTNTSLRQRLGIEPKNSAMASRLLKEALAAKVVRLEDEMALPKMRRYVPHWA
jgi:ATP-dependent DNA helicase RecG